MKPRRLPNAVKKKNRLKKQTARAQHPPRLASSCTQSIQIQDDVTEVDDGPLGTNTAPEGLADASRPPSTPATPSAETAPTLPPMMASLTRRVRLSLSVTDTLEWHVARLEHAWAHTGRTVDLHHFDVLLTLLGCRRPSVFSAVASASATSAYVLAPPGLSSALGRFPPARSVLLYKPARRAPHADASVLSKPPPGFIVVMQVGAVVPGRAASARTASVNDVKLVPCCCRWRGRAVCMPST